MLDEILTTITRFILGLVFIGLAIALFFIGIVVLWYFMLAGMALWILRRLYLAWKTRHSGPIQAGDVEIIIHENEPYTRQNRPRTGRIIEHE